MMLFFLSFNILLIPEIVSMFNFFNALFPPSPPFWRITVNIDEEDLGC